MIKLVEQQKKGTYRSEGGKNFTAEFDSPEHGLYGLSAPGELVFRSKYAILDALDESSAMPEHPRIHQSEDGAEAQFESAGSIPFGAEPSIRRKFRLMEGFLGVTTDFVIRTSFKVSSICAGGYTVTGPVKRIGIMKAPVCSVYPGEVEWTDFDTLKENEPFYDAQCPPVSILVESADSSLLEISTGEDFWRWITPVSSGASSRYTVMKKDNAVNADWNLYTHRATQPGEEPPPGRNRRINFYLAWCTGKSKRKALPANAKIFDMRAFDWTDALLAMNPDGSFAEAPCVSSSGVLNILKRFLRRNLRDLKKGDTLALTNVSPVFCSAAAHQDRAKMRILPHLDFYPLLDFKRWADKQLNPAGAEFRIIPSEDSVFKDFPVFR